MALFKAFFKNPSFRSFSASPTRDLYYFEYIPDIRQLDRYTKDLILHQTYTTILTCGRGISFDLYKNLSLDPKNISCSYLLVKERRFNTIIGHAFHPIYEFFYKDNDKSDQNRFITSLYKAIAIQPNFRGLNLGFESFNICEKLLKQRFSHSNRCSFNTTINPKMYEHRASLSPFVVPGPRKMPNEHPEKMMFKLAKELGHTAVSDENLYVRVYPGTKLFGTSAADNLKKVEKMSDLVKFFIGQVQDHDDWAMFNLALFNLVEGNTLDIAPGEYFNCDWADYDIYDYSSKIAIKI